MTLGHVLPVTFQNVFHVPDFVFRASIYVFPVTFYVFAVSFLASFTVNTLCLQSFVLPPYVF